MSIDKSILLDAHNIVYKNADGHDYGSFDQNMQDACNFAMVMTGNQVTMDMAYALMIGLKLAREKQNHKRDNMVDVCGYMEGWSEYREKQAWAEAKNEAEAAYGRFTELLGKVNLTLRDFDKYICAMGGVA